ncbi:hypothetical protein SEUCBS139899_008476 [Sporothrix eucalyptigena]|uniref:Uncharacterized protein n=1 Tax=Sporothrix eucalyptigena TaxID=1812306 RepID=A0ABP0C9H3_9PEZI
MRVLSLAFGLAAAASLALGNPCRPSHGVSSTTSSSAVPSSSASSVSSSSSISSTSSSASSVSSSPSISSSSASSVSSSSSSSISSTSSSAVALATFNVAVNGQLIKTYPSSPSDFSALVIGDSSETSAWTVNSMSLETGTNYLMVGSTTVVYGEDIGLLYTDSSLSSTESNHTPLICSDIYEGVALSCYPSNMPTYTNFYVNNEYSFDAISMFDPNNPPTDAVTVQLIPVSPN